MRTSIRWFFLLLAVMQLITPLRALAADDFRPGQAGEHIRRELFLAQSDVQDGDVSAATDRLHALDADITAFTQAFSSTPDIQTRLTTAWADVENAASSGNGIDFAIVRGQVWTALLHGSYLQIKANLASGDVDAAASWLLLREYRPTTRFARPSTDATIAIRDYRDGTITLEEVQQAVDADLLDTYQSSFRAELEILSDSSSISPYTEAEAAGLANGYWPMLAPAYAEQQGPSLDPQTMLDSLLVNVRAKDTDDVAANATDLLSVEHTFRAAPLSSEQQVRRSGQLTRYLELVSVEYGRGVHSNQVTNPVEIQEASAFLEGADTSFNDLYMLLIEIDPARTAQIESDLAWLRQIISDAEAGREIPNADEIRARTDGMISTLNGMYPEAWKQGGDTADFDVIAALLDQMENSAKAGDFEAAEASRLEAYAIYDIGPEKHLRAFAPQISAESESLFWAGTSDHQGLATLIANKAPAAEIHETRLALDEQLAEGQKRVGSDKPAEGVIIFNSATIVFREGLEGVLILASLVAAMIGENRKFKKPLITGAALALVATVALFWAAQSVLQSLSRYGEKLEAVISLIAIVVLLIIMNWFFHKVYWTRWIGKHQNKRRALIGGAAGQIIGLVMLGFTSVFREGAETVLFLQALTLDAGIGVVIKGTALGLLGTALIGVLVMVLQKKLPHKKMLIVTGLMIAFVLVVMVGTTTHVLQAVGWMPITPIDGVMFPYWMSVWFGLNATWQGVVLQVASLVLVIGSYFAAEIATGHMKLPTWMPFAARSA